jgi:rhamnosyltransferase
MMDLTVPLVSPDEVAGVMVAYFPDQDVVERVFRYCEMLGNLFVIDNTDQLQRIEFPKINGLIVNRLGVNVGVAAALNIGIESAVAHDYKWVLLLDQDSDLSRKALVSTLAGIDSDVGIVAPKQVSKKADASRALGREGFHSVDFTITSGSILSVDAFHKCGPFDERLFIDHIDHDYCLRLGLNGYKTLECLHAVMNHSLGDVRHQKFLGLSVEITSHKPFRIYYFFRNGIFVSKRYAISHPQFVWIFAKGCFVQFMKTVLFEANKILRIRMMLLGIFDGVVGRSGRRHI